MTPRYDYRCPFCEHIQEERHKMNETPSIKCNNCGKPMRVKPAIAPLMDRRKGSLEK